MNKKLYTCKLQGEGERQVASSKVFPNKHVTLLVSVDSEIYNVNGDQFKAFLTFLNNECKTVRVITSGVLGTHNLVGLEDKQFEEAEEISRQNEQDWIQGCKQNISELHRRIKLLNQCIENENEEIREENGFIEKGNINTKRNVNGKNTQQPLNNLIPHLTICEFSFKKWDEIENENQEFEARREAIKKLINENSEVKDTLEKSKLEYYERRRKALGAKKIEPIKQKLLENIEIYLIREAAGFTFLEGHMVYSASCTDFLKKIIKLTNDGYFDEKRNEKGLEPLFWHCVRHTSIELSLHQIFHTLGSLYQSYIDTTVLQIDQVIFDNYMKFLIGGGRNKKLKSESTLESDSSISMMETLETQPSKNIIYQSPQVKTNFTFINGSTFFSSSSEVERIENPLVIICKMMSQAYQLCNGLTTSPDGVKVFAIYIHQLFMSQMSHEERDYFIQLLLDDECKNNVNGSLKFNPELASNQNEGYRTHI